jgi:hypothetical protein
MAVQIKPKRTTTGGNVPSTSHLEAGEIAINLADKKLYVRDTSNNVLELTTRTLNSLDNVNISGIANDQILQYNNVTSKWENSSLTASAWSEGSGFIYNTSTVGIGTSTPNTSYKLDVNGTVNCSALYVGGAQVDGSTAPFIVTAITVGSDYTVPSNFDATKEGVVDIDTGVTVDISAGSTLSIT